jgi:hypothetical protein
VVRRCALAVVLVVLLGACRVDATTTVRVDDDGSGLVRAVVRLDRQAMATVTAGGGTVQQNVRLDDLRRASWKVRWQVGKDAATLTLEKSFPRASDAGATVAELVGKDGVLRGLRVDRHSSAFETKWSLRATADGKRIGADVTADPELVARLTAQRVDPNATDVKLTGRLRDALTARFVAELPHASSRSWKLKPGTTIVMSASSSTRDTTAMLELAVAIGVGVVALLLLVVGELRRGRRRRRRASAGSR